MLRIVCGALLFLMLNLAAGCGSSGGNTAPPPDETAKPLASKAEMKQRLMEIAKSGEPGSGMAALYSNAADMKATEPKLAEELQSGLDEMQKQSGNPGAVKATAKRLADKL